MPRHALALLSCAALLAPALAMAQDKPIDVFFRPCNVQQLNDAFVAALAQPGFLLDTKIAPTTLVVSIPDRVDVDHGKVSGTTWSYDVVFMRDGDPRGHSAESCNENKLSDCTDQLLSDIRSAAGQ
jgi:hypothetical protein